MLRPNGGGMVRTALRNSFIFLALAVPLRLLGALLLGGLRCDLLLRRRRGKDRVPRKDHQHGIKDQMLKLQ